MARTKSKTLAMAEDPMNGNGNGVKSASPEQLKGIISGVSSRSMDRINAAFGLAHSVYSRFNPAQWNLFIQPLQSNSTAHGILYTNSTRFYDLMDEMVDKDLTITMAIEDAIAKLLTREIRFELDEEIADDTSAMELRDRCQRELTEVLNDFDWPSLLATSIKGYVMHGFSVHETQWSDAALAESRYAPELYLHRHPGLFAFDRVGKLFMVTGAGTYDPAPENKFVLMRSPGIHGNPYGESLLKFARHYWYLKKEALRFWVRYADMYGFPFAKAMILDQSYGGKTSEWEALRDELAEAAKDMTDEHMVILPPGTDMSFETRGGTAGGSPHMEVFDALDRKITQLLTGGVLQIMEGKYGTRAQSSTHAQSADIRSKPQASLFAKALTRDLVMPWKRLNLPESQAEKFGLRVIIDTDDRRDVEQGLKIFEAGHRMKVPMSLSQFDEWFGTVRPKDEADTIKPQEKQDFGLGGGLNNEGAEAEELSFSEVENEVLNTCTSKPTARRFFILGAPPQRARASA